MKKISGEEKGGGAYLRGALISNFTFNRGAKSREGAYSRKYGMYSYLLNMAF